MNKSGWFYIALGCIAVSIVSMFTSIIIYIDSKGKIYSYNILRLLEGNGFSNFVLSKYTGPVYMILTGRWITVLAVISIVSIIFAVVGLLTLRVQYPTTWQFVLTITGLCGTLLPSLLIIYGVFVSKRYFTGELRCGIYPIITPIAMAVCVAAVLQRRDRVKKQNLERIRREGMIRKAGDIDFKVKNLQYTRKDEM